MADEKIKNVSRRKFLTSVGLSAAGLTLGVYYFSRQGKDRAGTGKETSREKPAFTPNVFVHIATSGLVTLYCHRSEMGQGIKSTLPVILADELGTTMDHVKVIQAVGDEKYGDQNTDGSSSIRGVFDWLRNMSAVARTLLIQAAAERWNVTPEQCETQENFVVLKGNKKKLGFGELAEEASKLSLPKEEDVKLRDLKELKQLGKMMPLIDGPAYIKGEAQYGADLSLPNMLIACIARPPVVGGKVKSLDSSEALKIKGVHKVIQMPDAKAPFGFQPWGGVAVLSQNTWTSDKAREALEIQWDHGEHADYNSEEFRQTLFQSARKGGKVHRKTGDVDKALKEASTTHEAEYYVPHLPHLNMEPPVAIADYREEDGEFCEVWAPTQNPQAARTEVARVLELDKEQVTVHVTLLGGGFGRKSKADFCSEAAWLSKQVKRPVRVQFTREDDVRNDYVNTVNAQVLSAGLNKEGELTAWKVNSAFPPIGSTFAEGATIPTPRDFQQGILDLPMNVSNFEAQACEAQAHARIGWLRSVYNIFHGFATNSFLDELAHKAQKDPLDFMISCYADENLSPDELGNKEMHNYGLPVEKYPVEGQRVRNVLSEVANLANWKDRKKDQSRGYGIAAHRSFLSYVGIVAAVKKDGESYKVDEVWVAIDAGFVVNDDRVRAQMEGSVLNGMSHLFHGGVTYKNGAVEQSNFDSIEQIRMNRAPRKIHTKIVRTDELAGGVGEPGVPPTAPAIANAIFDLSGQRIREFAPELLS